jgi:hypothetical protein
MEEEQVDAAEFLKKYNLNPALLEAKMDLEDPIGSIPKA